MALVKHQLASRGHAVEGYLEEDDLYERLKQGPVAVLVLGPGVEQEPRARCRAMCAELVLPLVEHNGGPDALVRNVEEALAKRPA